MSVAVNYISEGNNVRGPSICADGGLGSPDLEPRADYNDDWGVHTYTFGWIYSGLSSVDIVTREMADFHEFLEQNADNNIFTFVKGSEEPNAEKVDWDNLVPFQASDKPEFCECSFTLSNSASGERVQVSSSPHQLRPVERALSEDDISNFVKKLMIPFSTPSAFYSAMRNSVRFGSSFLTTEVLN